MDSIIEFLGQQSILVTAIIVIVALIMQDTLGETKSAKHAVDPESAAVMLFKGFKIYDIRDKESFGKSHILNAKLQNPAQLKSDPDKYMSDKHKYIFYCADGKKSSELAGSLRKKLNLEIYAIEDGLEAWKRAKLTLVKQETGK